MQPCRRRVELVLWCLAAGCAAPSPKPALVGGGKIAGPAAVADNVRIVNLAKTADFAPAAWAFISTDQQAIGQPELVLVVKRAPGERDDGYPADAVDIVSSLAGAVKKGRRLREWEMVGIPDGMLGRADLTGIIMGPAIQDPRVKVAGPTMTVLLITKDELEVAFHFGAPRVTNLLGLQEQFFPFPPWVDPKRTSVCQPEQMRASLVGQIGTREWIRGAGIWQELKSDPKRVILRLSRAAGTQMAATLTQGGPEEVVFFMLPPAEDVEARLVWSPLGETPRAIVAGTTTAATRIAGNFLALSTSDRSSGSVTTEDGFTVFLPPRRWPEALAALREGRPFEVAPSTDLQPFAITFSDTR